MSRDDRSADLLAAHATGFGIGLLALMLAWLTANRLASAVWSGAAAAVVAGVFAVLTGVLVTAIAARRLARIIRDDRTVRSSNGDSPGIVPH